MRVYILRVHFYFITFLDLHSFGKPYLLFSNTLVIVQYPDKETNSVGDFSSNVLPFMMEFISLEVLICTHPPFQVALPDLTFRKGQEGWLIIFWDRFHFDSNMQVFLHDGSGFLKYVLTPFLGKYRIHLLCIFLQRGTTMKEP